METASRRARFRDRCRALVRGAAAWLLLAAAATAAADVLGLSAFGVAGALAQGGFVEPPAADATDPYVVAQAAALGNDVQAIFAFVRDEIAGEPYRGSLRGARGALWSKAANPLDRSSLLIALLEASGVPARYARGNLGFPNLTTLIQSMFPPPSRGGLSPDQRLPLPAGVRRRARERAPRPRLGRARSGRRVRSRRRELRDGADRRPLRDQELRLRGAPRRPDAPGAGEVRRRDLLAGGRRLRASPSRAFRPSAGSRPTRAATP